MQASTNSSDASLQNADFMQKHPQGFGDMKRLEQIQIKNTYLLPVPSLVDLLPASENRKVPNVRKVDADDEERKDTYNKIMTSESIIVADVRRDAKSTPDSRAYLRAGPRADLFFDPAEVNAAIVTCGGLCPGLNNVIRDLTMSLWNLYGVRTIFGIRDGYAGFYNWKEDSALSPEEKERQKPLMLTPKVVSGIHHEGGTLLGSNRGGFDVDKILNFAVEHDVSQVYVIGGDGTHRGANKLANEAIARGLRISVAGIPKTIDNDVDLLDRSFGFNTAVEEAQRAIRSAKTEARCVPNGIGIVKLMGREAGFIAAHATLSSGDVDLCLVPEVEISIDGPSNCLKHLERVVRKNGNAVVVVAEGAGEELLGSLSETDAGGNKKLQPIGEFMKKTILGYFKQKNVPCTVKYIDPSYMIRSVAANAADSLYCMTLAQNSVHGAMAGFTGFTVGLSCNRLVYLPIDAVTKNSPRTMDPYGRTWERVLCSTRQPNTVPREASGAKSTNPPI